MKTRTALWSPAKTRRRFRRLAALALLALGTLSGCGREFYREWANQDVTEAIFEKSRDPRYRLDMFSITPPALARFADPYDPDRPPAPPDDFAAQSLSPVPQWPDHRLIMPVEGTVICGYSTRDRVTSLPHPDQPPCLDPPRPPLRGRSARPVREIRPTSLRP